MKPQELSGDHHPLDSVMDQHESKRTIILGEKLRRVYETTMLAMGGNQTLKGQRGQSYISREIKRRNQRSDVYYYIVKNERDREIQNVLSILLQNFGSKPYFCSTKEHHKINSGLLDPDIEGGWIKPGAAVIDVGINAVDVRTKSSGYRLVGDVNFQEASKVAGWITPFQEVLDQ
ncbi:hypothetical protein ACH5RR_010771 [Cinchona calisaya]|uniref:Tetrahydrofolate dehydrogenase/cyclohydrolase NAD(P)-binding domain-containing protein n=1 Tax=Cinchona calisaya TaxID=153742 RepID=A0ABD3AJV3_9GENT